MTILKDIIAQAEAIPAHIVADVEAILAKAHAEIDALLNIERKDAEKAEAAVDTAVAEVKETEGEVSAEVKSL